MTPGTFKPPSVTHLPMAVLLGGTHWERVSAAGDAAEEPLGPWLLAAGSSVAILTSKKSLGDFPLWTRVLSSFLALCRSDFPPLSSVFYLIHFAFEHTATNQLIQKLPVIIL